VDHSDFLVTKSRYEALFHLKKDDYKGWARGLKKAGYATSNKYSDLLIKIIEESELYKYDQIVLDGNLKSKRRHKDQQPLAVAGREVFLNNRIEYIITETGDSPASLREEMDLYPGEIFRYNNISRDYQLEEDMIIYLQPKRYKAEKGSEEHTLLENESMWDVSQLYGVRLSRLYRMNNLQVGDEVEAGTVLKLRKRKATEEKERVVKKSPPEEAPAIKMEFEEF
jgi:hypothetical protein